MIVDESGLMLVPGNRGKDCPGNGGTMDACGRLMECCCDECDDLMCCMAMPGEEGCGSCDDARCPRAPDSIRKKPSETGSDGK